MSYTSQISYRKPNITVSDILDKRQDIIHKQMYETALDKYMSYHGYDKDNYRVVEIPASYFDSPSRINIISKAFPYEHRIDSLEQFWGDYKFKERMSGMKLDNDLTIESAEVKYIDYVSGMATLHSRYSGRTFKVPIKDLPNDVKESDEVQDITCTFTYKVQNKVYGQD